MMHKPMAAKLWVSTDVPTTDLRALTGRQAGGQR